MQMLCSDSVAVKLLDSGLTNPLCLWSAWPAVSSVSVCCSSSFAEEGRKLMTTEIIADRNQGLVSEPDSDSVT